MSWPKEDMFAVTIDGRVLINARAFEKADIVKLARKKGVFIGVPVALGDVRILLEHVYDASSEVAARISGQRRWRRGRSKTK